MSIQRNAFVSALPVSFRQPSSLARTSRRPSSPRPLPCVAPRASLDAVLLAANPAWLESVANSFKTLGMPSWLVAYGHPAMMTAMVVGMGGGGAAFGWLGRLNSDKRAGVKQKSTHENIMLAFWMLAFLGGTGGVLSTAMQGYDILESPHAASAGVVMAILSVVGIYAYTGFSIGSDGSPKARMQGRTVHAWMGVATMVVFLAHGALGVKILLEG